MSSTKRNRSIDDSSYYRNDLYDERDKREGGRDLGESSWSSRKVRLMDKTSFQEGGEDKDYQKKNRKEKKTKRRRLSSNSDHEEVNEIQDDFEIDSVGKVENSEETLMKMKSAIIGILDEEIFSLAKKINE